MLKAIEARYSTRARAKRAALLTKHIILKPEDRVLDLGGGTGDHFHSIFPQHNNVVIADVLSADLEAARQNYGYATVQLPDDNALLPFADHAFDVVFCSSVPNTSLAPKPRLNGARTRRVRGGRSAGINGILPARSDASPSAITCRCRTAIS
jgi:SAM-dependent methyltransferase